ncbi:MAG: HipA domain-containing protein [Cyanobacteria bacterium]|nr:HipA domain-containing protein [Cyanobacteriota bacterium]
MSKGQARGTPQNLDHYEVVDGVSVGGATVKDVLVDPESGHKYIAKLGGRNSDLEVITEYAIFLVGKTLPLDIASAKIGVYRGQLRFLSRYFLDIERAEELVHGMQLFRDLYDATTVKGIVGNQFREQSFFTVQAVKAAFGATYLHYGSHVEDNLFDSFVAMLTHDALLGVQDRHHENWGIIVRRDVGTGVPRFAPLYDSARGLFCNFLDGQLRRFYGPPGLDRLDQYISKSRPLIGFIGLSPTSGRAFLTHDQLLAAIFHEHKRQRARIMKILESYDWQLVRDELNDNLPAGFCSKARIDLILTCLRRRQRGLYRAIHGSDIRTDI